MDSSSDESPQYNKRELVYGLDGTEGIHDLLSRMVRKEIPYFIWTIRRDVLDCQMLKKDQVINHYGKTGGFTTKVGLCLSLRNLPWYTEANPNSFFPRCYCLGEDDEKRAFTEDYRLTVTTNILKWVVHVNMCDPESLPAEDQKNEGTDEEEKVKLCSMSTKGKSKQYLSSELISIACIVCENHLGNLEHNDIDVAVNTSALLSETEWENITQQYYRLINGCATIANTKEYLLNCQLILNRLKSTNPQLEIEGDRNIWIVKPGAKSRGRGIMCMDKLEDILKLTYGDLMKDSKWVVQKYFERPLLIYNTKFDIRQWFLVTDWNPMTIWFYNDCYLRFSTQPFTLKSLESSIHLCNNSIQRNYKNSSERHPLVPENNMWSSAQFIKYLIKEGYGDIWEDVICPSMKEAIICTMKTAQDTVETRRGSFELYGADFLLGENFKPWLIEINSSPTMHPSTPVTANLCRQVQEDTIRVVIDRKYDKNCDTGKFELLCKEPVVEITPYNGTILLVKGSSIRKGKRRRSTKKSNKVASSYKGYLPSIQQHKKVNATSVHEKPKQKAKANKKSEQRINLAKEAYQSSTSSKQSKRRSQKQCERQWEAVSKVDRTSLAPQHMQIDSKAKYKPMPSKTLILTPEKLLQVKRAEFMDWTRAEPRHLSGMEGAAVTAKKPCLFCRGTFHLDLPCKYCSSFSMQVL
nr:PREDICTED: protein monoglycylase TTLL8 isoform X2 [Latimeria chalumnae]|eukprot:XP_014351822.1 PREDICTED: protein monoglycylase TTLL8 isoform X2 [Latimeria chalumnae]